LLVAMYALSVHAGDVLSALLLGSAAIVLALRATTECTAAMAAVVNAVESHELDRLPDRVAPHFAAPSRSRKVTTSPNGGSPATSEALQTELGLSRRRGNR
jgi:hypothetical protein